MITNYEEAMDYSNSVLYFTAVWCQPCKMLKPVLEKIDANFIRVDIDEFSDLSNQYEIRSVPTMIKIVDGKPVTTIVGAKPKKVLEEAFLTRLA